MEPRYTCLTCKLTVYCRKANGVPRYPEATLRVFKKRHSTDCPGLPEYRAGIIFSKVVGQ